MKEYKPPFNIRTIDLYNNSSVFLAGTIEMGNSIDWQQDIVEMLSDVDGIILNPRRDNWDSSWEQKLDNPMFREQVEWELYGITHADVVIMNILPNSISPITLIEFGLVVKNKNLIICCPDQYFRKGNIDVTSAFYGVPVFNSYEKFKDAIKKAFNQKL